MTLKRIVNSVKINRKLHRMPACKRLQEYISAGWHKRYVLKKQARGKFVTGGE